MTTVTGIHHITAIAGNPQENVDFYTGVLGLRLVKKSINQDAPDTYHLFFADAQGHPGTDLTFFPWPNLGPGSDGTAVWGEVSFAVPVGTLDYWEQRLRDHGIEPGARETRFAETVLPFTDPHGLRLALTETRVHGEQSFTPWAGSSVPEQYQLRALSSVRLVVRNSQPTEAFLSHAYGFAETAVDGEWSRYTVGDGAAGRRIDLRVEPGAPAGRWGVGSVHHVAFRVSGEKEQGLVRRQILNAGSAPTPVIDRFWFKSVYTSEPSGVICEVATDGPGFAVDEDPEHLGETLVLPPWYESKRETIESLLPSLRVPTPAPASPSGSA